MCVLMFGLALGAAGNSASEPVQSVVSCTADRLRRFVGPFGAPRSWPVVTNIPARFDGDIGIQISDQGHVADGYSHWLLIDERAATSYVVQRGGLAGFQTIYGPLPVAACSGTTHPAKT